MVLSRSEILRLISDLSRGTERSPRTISRHVTGSGDMYDRLSRGCELTLGRAARITQRLSDRWPIGQPWPADIPRPDPAPDSPYAKALASAGVRLVAAQPAAALTALTSAGEIASPAAFCAALTAQPDAPDVITTDVYYGVIRDYADGAHRQDAFPRQRSRAGYVFRHLLRARDSRFARRALRMEAGRSVLQSLWPDSGAGA